MEKNRLSKTARITKIALFTALMAVSVWVVPPITVPGLSVPFTLQSFFVVFAGFLLTPIEATLAMLAYLVIGAAGLPIFAGGRGGLSVILGPTGGFLLLFPAVAATIARFRSVSDRVWFRLLLGIVVGIVLLYPAAVVYASVVTETPYGVLLLAMIPYAILDVLKIAIAEFLACKIGRGLNLE